MRVAAVMSLVAVAAELVGCGLTLDLDPVATAPTPIDAGRGALDGATRADAALPSDASEPSDAPAPDSASSEVDAGSSEVDAGSSYVDAGATCTETPCRLLAPQCGCPADQACYPVGGRPTCLVEGTAGAGEACGRGTTCVAGLSCITTAGDTLGTCRPYCVSAADCSAPAQCVAVSGRPPGIGYCEGLCDPYSGGGCPTGLACYVGGGTTVDGRSVLVVGCSVGGTLGHGAPCVFPNDCASTFTCSGGFCRSVCVPGTGCGGSFTCAMLPGTAAGSPIGVCPG